MSWRGYRDEDEYAVKALLIEDQARLNITFDLPNLNERPILRAMVYEDNGVVTRVAVLEAAAEVFTIGTGEVSDAEWAEAVTELTQVCCAYRLRLARAFVPLDAEKTTPGLVRLLLGVMKRFGFKREKKSRVAVFTRWI